MRLSEVLVSVALFALLSSGIAGVYVSYSRNVRAAERGADRAKLVLETDLMLREAVSAITLPYWEDAETNADKAAATLLETLRLDDEVRIVSMKKLHDTAGRVRGLEIAWTVDERAYRTACLFASVPVLLQEAR
ncbi:MAG: hypothetical protein J6I73_01055 [Treponema sp.]|nr:hypothetical protein [Treponema sp.]